MAPRDDMGKPPPASAAEFSRLVKIAEAVERYATALAVSLGNFYGTNDFGIDKPTLWNGFVIDELQRDLLSMVVVRTSALLASNPKSTDATLVAAREIVRSPLVKAEIVIAAGRWLTDELLSVANAESAKLELDQFVAAVCAIDTARLKKHRNWMLAHSTTKTAPKMLLQEVWDISAETLNAAGHLCFFALGRARDFSGMTDIHRAQTLSFWQNFKVGDEQTPASGAGA